MHANPRASGRARRRTALCCGLLLAALALWASAAAAHPPEHHGARLVTFDPPPAAPAFTLTDPQGAPVNLADYRGRYVLLNFWATWCPPCVEEMPSMERLARHFADRPFVVLAVSLDADGAARVVPFIEKLGVTFPVALDPESRVSRVYGARELPSTFLINPEGEVIAAAKGERQWDAPQMIEALSEIVQPAS